MPRNIKYHHCSKARYLGAKVSPPALSNSLTVNLVSLLLPVGGEVEESDMGGKRQPPPPQQQKLQMQLLQKQSTKNEECSGSGGSQQPAQPPNDGGSAEAKPATTLPPAVETEIGTKTPTTVSAVAVAATGDPLDSSLPPSQSTPAATPTQQKVADELTVALSTLSTLSGLSGGLGLLPLPSPCRGPGSSNLGADNDTSTAKDKAAAQSTVAVAKEEEQEERELLAAPPVLSQRLFWAADNAAAAESAKSVATSVVAPAMAADRIPTDNKRQKTSNSSNSSSAAEATVKRLGPPQGLPQHGALPSKAAKIEATPSERHQAAIYGAGSLSSRFGDLTGDKLREKIFAIYKARRSQTCQTHQTCHNIITQCGIMMSHI